MKFIDLTDSSNLIITPDFTGVQNLEILVLNGCEELRELHPSIGFLKKLVRLDLMYCEKLICLPNTICSLKSLKFLNLSGCSNFDNLPENLGNVKGLNWLNLSGIAVKELPSSIGCLTSLTSLNISDCKNLVCLHSTICSLKLLESLDLSRCSNFDNLLENLGNVKGLKWLGLSETAVKELPSSIGRLTSLTSLNILNCKNLVCLPNTTCGFKFHGDLDLSKCLRFKNLPENPWIIEGLRTLDLSKTAIEEMPSSIGCLTNLTTLTLRFCINLVCFPSTICSLKSLNSLDLSDCNLSSIPNDIGCLSSLEYLNLSRNNFDSLPESISQLYNLLGLYLEGCKRLQSLENVPLTIDSVIANECTLLGRFPKLQFYPFRSDHSHLNF